MAVLYTSRTLPYDGGARWIRTEIILAEISRLNLPARIVITQSAPFLGTSRKVFDSQARSRYAFMRGVIRVED